jgi:HlyD family secretion protein
MSSKSKSPRPESPARKPRLLGSWPRKLIAAAVVLLLLFLVRMELRVAGAINALPVRNTDVRAGVEGIIDAVLVDEGQRVKPGDPIARLVDRDAIAELQKTEAQMDESRARLKLLEAGSRPEEIEVARSSVARYEEQLKFHRERLDRFKTMNDQQLISMVEYEESARRLASGQSDLDEAKKKLELLLAGSRPEEIEAETAKLASLESERRLLEERLKLMTVVSPAEGIVTTPSRQLQAMAHQLVTKGDLIASVHDYRTITAQIAVSEKEIADVRTGQPVALKVQAYPERIFPGKVTDIATTAVGAAESDSSGSSGAKSDATVSSSAGATKSANTIVVTTEIDNSAELLKPGMTGMAKIYCGKRRLIDLMTRRLSRTFRVEFWSWW